MRHNDRARLCPRMIDRREVSIEVVYLDWHIYSGLRQGSLDAELLGLVERASAAGLAVFPYTGEHLTEAFRGIDRAPGDIRALRRAIFEIIRRVSGGIYWHFRDGAPLGVLSAWDPEDAFATINEDSTLDELAASLLDPGHQAVFRGLGEVTWAATRDALHAMETSSGVPLMDLLPAVPRTTRELAAMGRVIAEASHRLIRRTNALGLDPRALNAAASSHTVAQVDQRLRATVGLDTGALVDRHTVSGPLVGAPLRAVGLNAVLQSAGFRQDRSPSHEGATSDGHHLAFAVAADVFVTNDRKLADRARAVAEGVESTVAISDARRLQEALQRCLEEHAMTNSGPGIEDAPTNDDAADL